MQQIHSCIQSVHTVHLKLGCVSGLASTGGTGGAREGRGGHCLTHFYAMTEAKTYYFTHLSNQYEKYESQYTFINPVETNCDRFIDISFSIKYMFH